MALIKGQYVIFALIRFKWVILIVFANCKMTIRFLLVLHMGTGAMIDKHETSFDHLVGRA